MNTTTHFKYIEWRDTNGLHEDTQQTLSDIKFLKDELQFLRDLVAEHTLELIYGKSSEVSKAIFNQLIEHTNRLEKLQKELEMHSNNLETLLDDNDVTGEVKAYKDQHYKLVLEEMDIHADVKKTKRIIFNMLSEIMKKGKQKKLT
jgi:uncharacterized protein (DUF342 family)